MVILPPTSTNGAPRVVKFRPRTFARLPVHGSDHARGTAKNALYLADNLARYGQGHEEPDDYRHRMLTNTAAIAFTALLTGIGVWLAVSIADLRNNQDCVLMGRRDCAHIASPKG